MRWPLAIALIALGGSVVTPAFDRELDRRAIELAQTQARAPDAAARQRLHAAYRLPVNEPPVDYVTIITPYRRVVLAAEEAFRAGRATGQRDALGALGDAPARVDIVVEFTFHPLNTFVGVPAYEVTLVPVLPGEDPIEPLSLSRVPRHGPRLVDPDVPVPPSVPQVPDASEPMLGGTVIAVFDGNALDERGVYDVLIMEGDEEIARVPADLGAVR
jgi:hypothetical protein